MEIKRKITRHMRPLKEGENGFTLLELMIALVVLAFGLIGVTGMMLTSVQGNSAGSKMTIATSLAQDKMEELRNIPYKSLYKTCFSSLGVTCGDAPDAMALDRDATILAQANDEGKGGDDPIYGGEGSDGIWTYEMTLPAGHPDNSLPPGMVQIWGVRRNHPSHNMVWLFSDVLWKNKADEADFHRVHLESVMGSFEK